MTETLQRKPYRHFFPYGQTAHGLELIGLVDDLDYSSAETNYTGSITTLASHLKRHSLVMVFYGLRGHRYCRTRAGEHSAHSRLSSGDCQSTAKIAPFVDERRLMTTTTGTASTTHMDAPWKQEMRMTEKVMAILRLSDCGCGSKRIAQELDIARNTVKRYLQQGDCRNPDRVRCLEHLGNWLCQVFCLVASAVKLGTFSLPICWLFLLVGRPADNCQMGFEPRESDRVLQLGGTRGI